MWSRLDKIVWVAVFQRTLLFVSSGGILKMDIVCFGRTESIPDYFVSVWKGTISMLFGLKSCHEMEGGWYWLWNSSIGSMIYHTTLYRKWGLVWRSG